MPNRRNNVSHSGIQNLFFIHWTIQIFNALVLVEWYNNLEHMVLEDEIETPVQAFVRKQSPKGISEEEMGADMHAKS